jgi:ribosomal protein L37AE/L43A
MNWIDQLCADDDALMERNRSKMGDYQNPQNGCPNCGRHRVMVGADGYHRCEKCAWCIQYAGYDSEFLDYIKG